MKYPTRCRIIDVTGRPSFIDGIELRTPEKSKFHIGKEGIARRMKNRNIKITLDDGNILMGHECWWEPILKERESV